MVRTGRACDACTKSCETFHRTKKDLSPIVTQFFKIMFGNNYSKVLNLPPEFAKSVKHLASQETQIEDSSGQQWSVTLSYVKGVLAFQKGWNKFSRDHGLEIGHLLVFNYIKGSHFFVHIFGRSAIARINFNNASRRENKRLRRDPETVSLDEPFQTTDVSSRHKPSSVTGSEFQNGTRLVEADASSGKLKNVHMNMEDPTCMINRDDEYYQREDRNFLYDLSSFEMEKETLDANKSAKTSDLQIAPCLAGIMEQTNTTGDDTQMDIIHTDEISCHSNDIFADKIEKALEMIIDPSHTNVKGDDNKMAANQNGEVFTDKFEKGSDTKVAPSHTEITEQMKTKGDDTQTGVIHPKLITGHSGDMSTDKLHIKPSDNSNLNKDSMDKISNFLNGNNNVLQPNNESPSIGSRKIAESEYAVKWRCFESSVSSSALKDPFGKHAIKKELTELGKEANCDAGEELSVSRKHGQMSQPVVKVEPDLPFDTVQSFTVSPFSAEVKSQSYLELPVGIPSCPGRRRSRGKVVYLRDPSGRLWPLLHPEIFSMHALTGNWRKFCQENSIKPGDQCRFQLENAMLCIYKVDIAHTGK